MYRIVGWAALQKGIDLSDEASLAALAHELRIEIEDSRDGGNTSYRLDGVDVTAKIRSPQVSHAASQVATFPGVREAMVAHQRKLGAEGGIVMEGRDIGTAVFPDADVKFFLDARLEIRAQRRRTELLERGINQTLEQVREELRRRDVRDSTRDASPLQPADDAVIIDTSDKSIGRLEAALLTVVKQKLRSQSD
jgi:cytidylate kinase